MEEDAPAAEPDAIAIEEERSDGVDWRRQEVGR